MRNNHVWCRILLGIAAVLVLAGCVYTETNPLPVRIVSPPTTGVWACMPIGGGPCQTSPFNYEGKYGCNSSPSKHCETQGGNCLCI